LGIARTGDAGETRAPDTGFNYWQGASLSQWTDAAIEVFVDRAAMALPGWSMGIGHYMHGQICRVDDRDTPLIRRQGSTSYFFNIGWTTESQSAAAMAFVDESLSAMRPFSEAASYVNYLSSGDEKAVATAYGENYRRLHALKRQFDPDNAFHFNRNIRPAPRL
jgi:hypothetical protein